MILQSIVLSGGSGTRLWPLSRRLLLKQFLPLTGEHTMLQDPVLGLKGVFDAAPLEDYSFPVLAELEAERIQCRPAPLSAPSCR